MSKCIKCENELITGDIHWEMGLCNNCYNELYKDHETHISLDKMWLELAQSFRDENAKLHQRISELEEQLNSAQVGEQFALKCCKDAEEQLKNAIKLPVKIGDKIYVVPSKTNFEINNIHHKERNRIYEWEVHEIRFNKYGYAVVSWIDNIPLFCVDVETGKYDCGTYNTERFYGETWFKTKEEAQAKLKELQGENNERN